MKFREGPVAISALIAVAVWLFVVLPIYYGPRYNDVANAGQRADQKRNETA